MRRNVSISLGSLLILLGACTSAHMPKYNFAELRAAEIENEFPADTDELKARMARIATPLLFYNASLCPSAVTRTSRRSLSYDICSSRVELVVSPVYNAYFDPGEAGGILTASTALTRRLDDNGLAFIVAHELAHHIGAHEHDTRTRHDLELEADYMAVFLMTRAGYDPAGIEPILRQIIKGQDVSTQTHPALYERLETIEQARKDIMEKQARGAPLTPF